MTTGYYNNRMNGDGNDHHHDDGDDDERFLRKQAVKEGLGPKRISHLQFGLLSAEEMQRLSEIRVTSPFLFSVPSRKPAAGGCLDPRLGISDKASVCGTCGQKLVDCAGHFGYIPLALPVFHIGFVRHALRVLQCICKSCSAVLLRPSDRTLFLRRMRQGERADALYKQAQLKKLVDTCKKCRTCPSCGATNGTVKKITGVSTLKIVHERYKKAGTSRARNHVDDEWDGLLSNLEQAIAYNPDIAAVVAGGVSSSVTAASPFEDLTPTRALELFLHVTDEDCEVLWMDPLIGRPENLILQTLLVPAVPIRPSVAMDAGGGSNEDDLTVKLQEIIEANVALELALTNGGAQSHKIQEYWDSLQLEVAQYVNGEMPGLRRPVGSSHGNKPIRGLCQRLKGKQGRFRGNLSGKRVDFSARTVISPDPNLRVDQVGVPRKVAMTMTYPERVNRYNIDKLRERVENGPDVHPGANLIRMRGTNGDGDGDGDEATGFVKSLAFGNRREAARNLRPGDVVERHMEDDDVVLFNRQPSLHKTSIMAHRVKVMEWKTFRFNTCVCAPYNADFDGDEMNMHLPQTEEARTEASLLMGVVNNLMTPRNGEPLVAASQDFLSASYLLTQRNQYFDRDTFCQLVGYFGNADEQVDVPPPAILKPVQLWTGKQLFGCMLKPNKQSRVLVNMETKEKNYTSNTWLCERDGWVIFRNSELVTGNIAKKSIGDGSKTGLLYVLMRDYGPREAAAVMNRWAQFCGRYMGGHVGLSIGISDVTPSAKLRAIKHDILREGYRKADELIALYERGELELRPGCDLLQSLEEMLNGVLGRLRESAGQQAMKALEWSNSPRIMATCGSKGSPLNISQMAACVGQQAVGGSRIQNGFADRTLPHFPEHSLTPAAKGFVANSFYTGLTATEFFFHMMGGREGLVDTAVKTAETGYMARRLMKALEDLSLQYDSTVRNSENTVVQFTYGDDGLNPAIMENNDRPVDFHRLRVHISQIKPCPTEPPLKPDHLVALVEDYVTSDRFQALLPTGRVFLQEVRDYFTGLAEEQRQLIIQATERGVFRRGGDDDDNVMDERRAAHWTWNSCRVTATQLDALMEAALEKCLAAFVEPGEAVGAVGAQSISEPGTQMTLKTFHFSGISSMNVTLGVPRLKEIINAAKQISTPIITAKLEREDNKVAARIVKAGIEKTTLGGVSKYLKEVYSPQSCYISIELDLDAIEQLKLNVDALSVRRSILRGTRGVTRNAVLRSIKDHHIFIRKGSKSKLRVHVPDIKIGTAGSTPKYFAMQMLKTALPDVIVQGIPTVGRAVINESEGTGRGGTMPTYNLLMEGYGLQDVMGSPGIDGLHTTTNHVLEIEAVLGVEAARTQISAEIFSIMNAYGIGIDTRHLLLLSDVMTFRGEVLGITRFGVSKMRESVLMLASFEKTTDHLFDAAVHGRTDAIVGVSECIIMGMEVPIGTGLPSLFWKNAERRANDIN